MRRLTIRCGVLLATLGASTALACGGPDVADVGACVASPGVAVNSLVNDGSEENDLEPFRFLDPFVLAHRPLATDMANRAYQDHEFVPAVDTGFAAFEAALTKHDRKAAHEAANKVIATLLALPAPFATPFAIQLSRAVEYLELEPSLSALDVAVADQWLVSRSSTASLPLPLEQARQIALAPREDLAKLLAADPKQLRAPSLELAVLRQRMAKEIPDGWPGKDTVAPWKELLAAHDAWLARYATHPLADLARLQKVRVLYLHADNKAAGQVLLELLKRLPGRATWELRHLLLTYRSIEAELTTIQDPVLMTALLRGSTPLDGPIWAALWARAQQSPKEPWAKNLEERLLANSGAAGKALPLEARQNAVLWMQLHTAALLTAQQPAAALAQARLLDKTDAVSARLWSQAALRSGEWREAVELSGVDEPARRFVLQVVMPEPELEKLATTPGPRRSEAALALAGRKLGDGEWAAGAALLQPVDPKRAALWSEAAKRAADASGPGRLAFARWLKKQPLFAPTDTAHSRGLKSRLEQKVPTDQPLLAMVLLRTGSRERALEAYAQALLQLPAKSKEASAALREADALYNELINWDAGWGEAYPEALRDSHAAELIRAAGKAIRAK